MGMGGAAPSTGTGGEPRGVAGGGWADGTYSTFPDWLQVDFAGAKTIDEIDVFTVQDNYGTAEASYQRHDFCPLWID